MYYFNVKQVYVHIFIIIFTYIYFVIHGKNLTWKAGGVDGCDSKAILKLLEEKKIDTTPLITHTYHLKDIEEAYDLFENRRDGVIKVAIEP